MTCSCSAKKWQSGGNMMLLLKLHPCVVTDERNRSLAPRGSCTHTSPQCGRADTPKRKQQVRGPLPTHCDQDRQHYAPANPAASTGICVLTTKLPATSPPIQAKLPQQQSLNHVFKITHLKKAQTAWPDQPLKQRYAVRTCETPGSGRNRLYHAVPRLQERFKSEQSCKLTIPNANTDDLRNMKGTELSCKISTFAKRKTSLHSNTSS